MAKRLVLWALILAASAGLGFGFGALTFKPPDPNLEGSAISQTPSTPASPRPAANVLPDLVGLARPAAERKLETLDVLFLVEPVGGGDTDLVTRQFPQAGTPLKQTTHVMLNVQCKPRPCPQPPGGKQLYDPCSCAYR